MLSRETLVQRRTGVDSLVRRCHADNFVTETITLSCGDVMIR